MRGFTLIELLVVIVIIALIAILIVPFRPRMNAMALRAACGNNLSQIGKALIMYSDVPAYGTFPTDTIGARGRPLPSLGILYRDYIGDYRAFSCNANRTDGELKAMGPTLGATPSSNPLNATMSHYGYDPGNKGTGYTPHTPKDSLAAIAADFTAAGVNSDNHGGRAGQNVLLGSGSVEWRESISNTVSAAPKPVVDPDITSDSGITDSNWLNMESFISQ